MARLVLIAVLLVQPLAAQAVMAGMCVPARSGQHAEHGMGMQHVDQRAAQTTVESNCDCHCAFAAGHCSGGMVGVLASTTAIDLPLRTVAVTHATDALPTGYRTAPYRPPSAIA